MEPVSLLENKPYPACRCGDSRLKAKTNDNFLSKCGQCKQKWRGSVCSNCGFHCCLQCREINQNEWQAKISKLSHWNNNALKQQQEFKNILQSIPQIFILYNNKKLVKTLCNHIYSTRNKDIFSLFLDIIGNNDKILLSAFYDKFQDAIHCRNLSELLHLKYLDIINRKYLYEFRKKNGINALHYICTINVPMNNIHRNMQIIQLILQLIIKYKLLRRNIYDIISIFEFSTFCGGDKEKHKSEIINILDMYISAEIKERGLIKWINGYSLRRLPLYDYVSWTYCKKVPFYVVEWMVINTINYKIVPHFLAKHQEKAKENSTNIAGRHRSQSHGHNQYGRKAESIPIPNTNKSLSASPTPRSSRHIMSDCKYFKTYNRIFKPLLVCENNYVSHREVIYKWMEMFIAMDSEIVLLKSCDKYSFPLNDGMALNSNMVETMMSLCKDELYTNYSLHSFIDIACLCPKIECQILKWIQICVEKYDKRLLFKNYKHLSPLKYAETHSNYYCSQIILYLKRKQQPFVTNEVVKEEEKYNQLNGRISEIDINKLQNEIFCLKQENLKWKQKYFKLNTMYKTLLNENENENKNNKSHHRMHSYPTPNGVGKRNMKKVMNGNDNLERDNKGFLIKGYREWNCNDTVNWIINLNAKYRKYENILKSNVIKENIRGIHLSLLNRNDLARLGINDFADKYDIVEQIRILVNKYSQNIQEEGHIVANNNINHNNDNDNHPFQYPSPYN